MWVGELVHLHLYRPGMHDMDAIVNLMLLTSTQVFTISGMRERDFT